MNRITDISGEKKLKKTKNMKEKKGNLQKEENNSNACIQIAYIVKRL